jgi:hypothetical protein
MLPKLPPRYASWAEMLRAIQLGDTGWPVYALQVGLNSVGRSLDADGSFGARTERAVTGFQAAHHLAADGEAGARTQSALIEQISHKVHEAEPLLPDGLLRGFAETEGANLLAATNWFTPPGGDPGCDCGVVQWRQYGPPFDPLRLKQAFNAEVSFRYASRTLLDRMADYGHRRPGLLHRVLLRTAVLAHNAPFLAEQIVRNGKLSTPNAPAAWTSKPGGGHYTHQEWYRVYTDNIMKYVTEKK